MSFPRLVAALVLFSPHLAAADPFEFKDGDRVVLIGSTLIEREQKSGYWELLLTLKNYDKTVTFRNLGWSGDTVHAEARGRFDYADAAKRLDELVSLTTELKPTVLVVCYGQNESFDGPAGIVRFRAGLSKLLDALAPTKARVVLVSPTPFEKAPGLPDPAARNADLTLYRDALADAARQRGADFVDLFDRLRTAGGTLTDNGIHLTPDGYLAAARALVPGVGWAARTDVEQAQLRSAIVAKNRLFFHRWRPQNETYLFGFRKHEQGKNAAEVAAFDPLVAAVEKEIAMLKTSVTMLHVRNPYAK